MSEVRNDFAPGVITGTEVKEVFALAKAKAFALPACNVTGSNTMNGVMEAAAAVNSPVIIQFSHGGAAFVGGKGIANSDNQALDPRRPRRCRSRQPHGRGLRRACHPAHRPLREEAARLGRRPARRRREALRGHRQAVVQLAHARSVRGAARGERRDQQALPRADVGDRHDARDRARASPAARRTASTTPTPTTATCTPSPKRWPYVYDELMKVSDRFTVAAAFGNVHGVYKPGNVKLKPTILRDSQEYIQAKLGTGERPVDFVFHGGSGSSPAEIAEAISYGVVKMNIDTDLQWAFWDGIRAYDGRQARLPAEPDRQPRRPRQAEQEVLRPARVAARRRGQLRRARQAGLRRAQQRRNAGVD